MGAKGNEILDEALKRLEESSRFYHSVLKRAHEGAYEQKKALARTGGDAVQGGSRTALWDRLADEKAIVSLVVTSPPAWDNETKLNETKLKMQRH